MEPSLDLFTYAQARRYPDMAGAKCGGASLEAAIRITASGKRTEMQLAILRLYETRVGLTPDEAADMIGCTVHNARSRFSELKRANVLIKTDYMRTSKFGMNQHVYCKRRTEP